ncbi:MAG: hypothetical protein LV481_02650 [Methylacidiphilales bacterium]|nr:hypothetical protein [Candidatus Methylacidiphilales bacterium]
MNDSHAPLLRRRVLGLAGTALGFYLVFGVALAKVDVSWLLPTQKMASEVIVFWRDLPFFTVEKSPAANGNSQVTYYTVPTQQVTRQEMALMMGTNTTAHPAPPSGAGTSAKTGN